MEKGQLLLRAPCAGRQGRCALPGSCITHPRLSPPCLTPCAARLLRPRCVEATNEGWATACTGAAQAFPTCAVPQQVPTRGKCRGARGPLTAQMREGCMVLQGLFSAHGCRCLPAPCTLPVSLLEQLSSNLRKMPARMCSSWV